MTYRAILVGALVGIVSSAWARGGMITANFTDPSGIQLVNFNSTFATGETGGASAAIVDATRTDSPGPGVDTLIPTNFRVFCVEVGQNIYVPQVSTFANVELLSATQLPPYLTTNPGPDTGPVVFNNTRTTNLQKLFGAFYPGPTDVEKNDAFQLALWKLAFDDDFSLALNPSNPNQRMWVDPSNNPNPAVTTDAQSYLNAIEADTGNLLPQAELALLTDPTVQDQLALIPVNNIGNVPEPMGVLMLLPMGALVLCRRARARGAEFA
jgi:hypothetical protein